MPIEVSVHANSNDRKWKVVLIINRNPETFEEITLSSDIKNAFGTLSPPKSTLFQNCVMSGSHGGEYEDGCLLVCCAV
jgi:hypothetical protein